MLDQEGFLDVALRWIEGQGLDSRTRRSVEDRYHVGETKLCLSVSLSNSQDERKELR